MNLKIFRSIIIIFSLIHVNEVLSDECKTKNNLRVGVIESDYIDYKYYLYYVLGEYSFQNSISFEINDVKNNPDEFDIIFGEYSDLNKLSLVNINLPLKIKRFYKENEILISNNILPLDLDTFVLISKDEIKKLNFDELSNYYNSLKYTLGMSFKNKNDFTNLFLFISEQNEIDVNTNVTIQILDLFKKTYKNTNKNNFNSNLTDIYSSYEESENIFTLFSDGVLLYKNLNYKSFQLFPKPKYYWNEKEGVYKERLVHKPISFFGFSAYLNNTSHTGFLCYLIEKEVRLKTFQDFNIQLSPLSINEIGPIEKILPKEYLDILINKNKTIYNYEKLNEYNNIDQLINIIIDNSNYQEVIELQNYLN